VMFAFIKKTAELLGITGITVLKSDVFRFMSQCEEQFDFIFAGPPYALQNIDELPRRVIERQLLNKNGWLVLEHTPRNNFEGYPLFVTRRNYGTTVFSIFVNKS
jgi:16S rRNA (guanine966-N2)-methyltransferase